MSQAVIKRKLEIEVREGSPIDILFARREDKKLGNTPKEILGPILRKCAKKHAIDWGIPAEGFRILPADTWEDWAEAIKEEYPLFGIREIPFALKATNVLKYENQPKHYGSFTLKYLSEIFTEYLEWSRKKLSEGQKLLAQEAEILPDTNPKRALEEFVEEVVLAAYANYRNRENPKDRFPELDVPPFQVSEIYSRLEEMGAYRIEDDRKWELYNEARDSFIPKHADKKKSKELRAGFLDRLESDTVLQGRVTRKAKEIAAYTAFMELERGDISVNELRDILSGDLTAETKAPENE